MGAEKLACIGGLLCARHLRGIDAFNLHDNRIPGRGNRLREAGSLPTRKYGEIRTQICLTPKQSSFYQTSRRMSITY